MENGSAEAVKGLKPHWWQRWRRRVAIALALSLLLVALLPYLLQLGPVRRAALALATRKLNGRVEVGSARLGWFSPIELRQIEVVPWGEAPVARVGACRLNRSLWQLLTGGRNLGKVDLENAEINIVPGKVAKTNLRTLLVQPEDTATRAQAKTADAAGLPNIEVHVRLLRGDVNIEGPESPHPWQVSNIRCALGLVPAPRGALVEVVPGPLIDHVKISPAMCHDLLGFVAPNLAGATEAQGEFSASVSAGEIPRGDWKSGRVSGTLVVHNAEVSAGAIVRRIAELLRISPTMRLAPETPITFKLADGRVEHTRFEFTLAGLPVAMQGSVGLDESLGLLVEVPFPSELLDDGTLKESLAGRTVRLPIGGTLKAPKVDLKLLPQGEHAGLAVAQELWQAGKLTLDALRQRLAAQGKSFDGHRFSQWLGRREVRRQMRRGEFSAPPDVDSPPSGVPPGDELIPSDESSPPAEAGAADELSGPDAADAPSAPPKRDRPLLRRGRALLREAIEAGIDELQRDPADETPEATEDSTTEPAPSESPPAAEEEKPE